MYLGGLPGGSAGKESACNVGNLGSILVLGGSPGEGNWLQYFGLKNSVDYSMGLQRVRHDWATFNFHFTTYLGAVLFQINLKFLK